MATGLHHHHHLDLFGGSRPWNETEWVAQDDRLRGGASISHLNLTQAPFPHGSQCTIATFYGTLDSKTLGGTGFASQRTIDEDYNWDLDSYEGLEVVVLNPPSTEEYVELQSGLAPLNDRVYTILLKDCIIRGEPDAGREISWQWDFKPSLRNPMSQCCGKKTGPFRQEFNALWEDFKPFYRGRLVDTDKKLNTKTIKRFSIMIRSFFQEQPDGTFAVSLVSISAVGGKKSIIVVWIL